MQRGDIYWYDEFGHYVVVVTRDAAIGVRSLVTVAACITRGRSHPANFKIDHLPEPSWVNLDDLNTVPKADLVDRVAALDAVERVAVCEAMRWAYDCG